MHLERMKELHLVLGAGQVGSLVAEQLLEKGHRVRVAKRSPGGDARFENVSLDVRDADAVARAADGATVVYNCTNPLYHQWNELLLPMVKGAAVGAAKAGARLVVLDNLYMYGDNSRMHEAQPTSPVSKKGMLREKAGEWLLSRSEPIAIGRAADFFGPKTPFAMFGERVFERALAGRAVEVFGDLDQPHSYAYTVDVARALVALGSRETGGVWMLPVNPTETTRQLLDRYSKALGVPVRTTRIPKWVLRGAGVFAKQLGETVEMIYQWEHPYVVDDSKFRAAFGFGATPWNEAIRATTDWARATFRAAA
jgi:nucleoside-diphosphate-sugar epimerase